MPPRSFAAPPPFSSGHDEAKAELRARARAARRAAKADNPDAAELAAALAPLARLAPWPDCVVAAYHPIGAELDPGPLAVRLRAAGAAIASPVVTETAAPLVFRLHTDDEPVRDLLGLAVPPPTAPEVRPDVVIVPLLAFDRGGARLGQGGGYYDRTLARLRAAGPVLAIGLAYAAQQVDQIPTGAFDQRLDGVLTETAYLEFNGDQ